MKVRRPKGRNVTLGNSPWRPKQDQRFPGDTTQVGFGGHWASLLEERWMVLAGLTETVLLFIW